MEQQTVTVADDFTVASSGDEYVADVAPTPPPPPVAPQADGDAGAEEDDVNPPQQAASEAGKTLAKHKKTAQDRINDLVREKYRLEGELHAYRSQRPAASESQPSTPPTSASDVALVEPKEEDYATYKEYVRAEALYQVRLAQAADRQERAQWQAQQSQHALVTAFTERVTAFKADHPDYDAVTSNPELLAVVHPYMHRVIAESGPALAYYLGSHPEDCTRLAALPTADQLNRAIGRIEAQLEAPAPAASVKPIPSAPPAPIAPLNTGGSAAAAAPEDLEFGPDYIEAMNAKDKARKRRF